MGDGGDFATAAARFLLQSGACFRGDTRASNAHNRFTLLFFRFAAWTALQLLTAPATAHRHVAYHRSAKSQWARDDPAFAALLGGLVAGAAAAAGATFAPSVGVALRAVVRAVLLDYVGVGVGLATVGW